MRKSLAALATVTLLSLSSACGGSADDATPAAATASAESKSAAAATSSTGLTRDNFVERLSAAQKDAGSAHLEMESNGSSAVQGDVQLADTLEDSRTRLTMELGAMKVELRLVDGVAYLKLGQMTGGKYVKVDLTDPDDPLVKQYGALAGQVDPRAQLETFESALVEFEDQGPGDRIEGVETTKVRLVLDPAKMLQQQSAGKERRGAQLPKQLEYVLHVDSDDLMRQMTTDINGTPTTLTWTKWGEPVEVAAPPASKVTDSGALAGLAGLGSLNPRA